MKLSRMEIQNDLRDLEHEVRSTNADLQENYQKLEKRLKKIERNIELIKKSQNEVIDFFDKEGNMIRKRLDRVEETLELPPLPAK